MSKPQVIVRMAENEDGQRIRELVEPLFGGDDLSYMDWEAVKPWWIVATHEGRIVGCIQIGLSRPMAVIEHLSVEEGLPHRLQANVVQLLVLQAMETLRQSGADAAFGIVSFARKSYKRVLQKRGAVIACSGHKMFVRLT